MPQKVRIIGVPMDLGASRRGVDMGPSALRVAGLQSRIKHLGLQVEDIGDVTVVNFTDKKILDEQNIQIIGEQLFSLVDELGRRKLLLNFSNVEYLAGVIPVHQFMTYCAYFTAAAQILFVVNLFWSMKKGPKAPVNPWNATSLEWTIPSPPPFDNFAGVHPVVNHGPYEYSVPGAERDFIMQTDPPTPVPAEG